jgi:hypothetical protein
VATVDPNALPSLVLPAVSRQLLQLLEEGVAGLGVAPPVSRLIQPREISTCACEGLTLTLLSVEPNPFVRNLPPAPDSPHNAPLSCDARYLVIPWAREAWVQQSLLAGALRQLHHRPVLRVTGPWRTATQGDAAATDPGAEIRLVVVTLSLPEAASLAAILGVAGLPPSIIVKAGPIELAAPVAARNIPSIAAE